ncbi:hypothetical protein [Candidatus Nitrotoga sp. M5]|uniref:hypothetical protein n=1 Tax=Candidatus Nitrotoga sp. M5 TaxID=2890409 RepID=UPI001EF4BC58|nr:hypothetical protein [Candidatus Nitrotoga sp. M5]
MELILIRTSMLAKIAIFFVSVLAMSAPVQADNMSERRDITNDIKARFKSIESHFKAFDRAKDARSINKIQSDIKVISQKVKELEIVTDGDSDAKKIIQDYPREIPKFLNSLTALKAARVNQFKLDPIAEVCEKEDDELREAVSEFVEAGDPNEIDEIEDLAEDVEDKVSGIMKGAASLLKKVDGVVRKAKQFSYRTGHWNATEKALDRSADTITNYMKNALKEAEGACKDLMLGDAQDFVKDAVQQLDDIDQLATDFVADGEDWFKSSRQVFSLSCEAKEEIRKAYCKGDYEPDAKPDVAKANAIANAKARAVVRELAPIIKEYEALKKRGEKLNENLNNKEVTRILNNMSIRAKGRNGNGGLSKIAKAEHLRGSRDPMIQLWIKHGVDQHKRLQKSNSCDLTEIPISGAPKRPDCVSTKSCMVYEFKPEGSHESSAASGQVAEYAAFLNDILDEISEDLGKAAIEAKSDKLVAALLKSEKCRSDGFNAEVVPYKRCDGTKLVCPKPE